MLQADKGLLTVLLLFLSTAAYYDLKTGKVHIVTILFGAAGGMTARLSAGTFFLPDVAAGAAGGGFLLLLGLATHQAIGYGDGLLIMVTGIFLGWYGNFCLLVTAFFLSAVCSVLYLLCGLKKRSDTIPFAPFLLFGYLVLMGIGW